MFVHVYLILIRAVSHFIIKNVQLRQNILVGLKKMVGEIGNIYLCNLRKASRMKRGNGMQFSRKLKMKHAEFFR